eukprot:m.16313 g.16313  ORF g.16313 m.16313 type:complete len:174 (-) comp10953_c0_seq1:1295-1816(-)
MVDPVKERASLESKIAKLEVNREKTNKTLGKLRIKTAKLENKQLGLQQKRQALDMAHKKLSSKEEKVEEKVAKLGDSEQDKAKSLTLTIMVAQKRLQLHKKGASLEKSVAATDKKLITLNKQVQKQEEILEGTISKHSAAQEELKGMTWPPTDGQPSTDESAGVNEPDTFAST